MHPDHQIIFKETVKFSGVSDTPGILSSITPDPEHSMEPSYGTTETQGQLKQQAIDPTTTPPKTPPKRRLELDSREVYDGTPLHLNPGVDSTRPVKRRRRAGDDLTIAMNESIYQPKDGRRPVRIPGSRKDATPPITARRTAAPEGLKKIQQKSSSTLSLSNTAIQTPSESPSSPIEPAPPSKWHRSTEGKKASKTPSRKIVATPAPIQEAPLIIPSVSAKATVAKPPTKVRPAEQPKPQVEVDDRFMPNEENGFHLRYGSKDGRLSAKELESLLNPPRLAEPELFSCYMSALSFKRLGQLPVPGLANTLIKKMERGEKDYQRWVQGGMGGPEEWWDENHV
ncbi:uncharacterized protein EI97DRAFT_430438 [Westerdykella ornata]|uniref:Uncharacterized protein n=1 Tax=Westerdykella ornata TaxID=318751 RepID=A0A6A6JSI3_WESOR|nr:uncharacterized protein EI97DRAFT_430438 [Westerdykella ornata]KAF2279357.1 hypothetical protein EI97DRAFT_430438 [Westerdykella ornata]